MNRRPRIYRLDGIEIDTVQVCLKRNGQEQHIRQKTFQVLIYLLEHRRRLVTKNELIEDIWQGVAVTDNTLEQCLAEIRRVIGDDSRRPRFIRTIPRTGYRFIAPVDEVAPDEISDQPVTLPGNAKSNNNDGNYAASRSLRLKPIESQIRRFALIPGVLLLLVVCAAGLYVFRRRSSASPSLKVTLADEANKRAVAIMFFENGSSSADIDWLREGLADMLITDLARSKDLAVLSRQQLRVLLDRIGHKESEKIKLDEALDVANKSQAKIVILGSFARLGDEIRIDVHLHDARDGQLLTAERLVVDKPSEILTQVDLLSLKLASYLGAPAQTEANASLADVMTNNLEAYRYYSLGVEKTLAVQNPEAIALLEKAIALDPQFAMAYARIGYAYAVNWNRIDRGKPYLEKAFQLSARLTDKDKLYIGGWYAIVNFDFARAIQSFREIVARFPLEVEAYQSLAILLDGEERFDEAIEVLKQGLIIDPESKDLYNHLGAVYLDMGRRDEATEMFQRYVQLAPQEPNAHDSLASGYQWAGRYPEAIAEYDRALALKPDFEIAIIHLGNAYFQQGRSREAIEQYEHYIRIAPSDVERARGYNSIATVERKRGDLESAERSAKTALKNDKGAIDQLFFIALERRDLAAAERLKEEMERVQYYTRGTRGSHRKILYFRGRFDLASGRSEEAVREFKEALTHRPEHWNIDAYEDCLANAFLELGRFDEAIAEYERVLRVNPNYPLVHYHLAQAYERKGQKDQARTEYERFLEVWKDADADIPELMAARQAMARI